MPYREPPTDQAAPILYGITPPRGAQVFFGLLIAGLGGFLLNIVLGGESLRCERSGGGGACELGRSSALSSSSQRFRPDEIRDVRYNKTTGKGGRVTGAEVVLLDTRGAETRLRWSEPALASDAYERARAFFVERRAGALDLATDRDPWGLFLCAAMIAGGLAALVGGLRWAGRLSLLLDRSGGRLYITRRALGRRRESWAVPLAGVTGVEVELGPLDPNARSPEIGARVSLFVEKTGRRLPLTRFLPGERVHRRAAEAIRRALNLPEAPEPAAPARPAWLSWGRLRRPVLIALGLISAATAGQLALLRYASATQGWLSLRCEARCRFGGMECLPGGEVEMSLDPGEYTIEVFAPDAPGGWEPRRLTLARGEAVSFVCAPAR